MLKVEQLRKQYAGREKVAIEDVTFRVSPGEFVSIVGPSGAGKTTLLRCIAGLHPPTLGTVTVAGHTVHSPPPEMAVVFQDYTRSLFPWMSIRNNVLFALKKRRDIPEARKESLSHEMLAAVGLKGFERYYPWELSGGMQQRVAIARALAYQPRVLLMDEPFASVDAQTRAELEDLLLELWQRYSITVLFVTHDIDEAVYLSDRVVVLTTSPARVHRELTVPLPRPRDQMSTRAHHDFHWLRALIFRSIRGEQPGADGNHLAAAT